MNNLKKDMVKDQMKDQVLLRGENNLVEKMVSFISRNSLSLRSDSRKDPSIYE
jgi:hypothetical protein